MLLLLSLRYAAAMLIIAAIMPLLPAADYAMLS